MRRLLAAVLVASALGAPGPPVLAAVTTRAFTVPTRHGDLHLTVATPAATGRFPVVLTYSPYSVLGRDGEGTWTSRGYARAWADVVGTGNSGGCYDYGGRREKETAYDLVEWIARQPWSTGKVGMIGGSYNGTTAIAAAVTRPPHLATVVPEAAISRWYDYAYSGGMRYTLNNEDPTDEGIDTPLLFDFGFAVPPPLDFQQPGWQQRVRTSVLPCDELAHTERGYDPMPDYDAFWVERDYARDAGKVTIPVLVAHNWGDWNVKQETGLRFWAAATRSPYRRLVMGTRHAGHSRPGGDYPDIVEQWMERWLKGVPNGIERALPPVTSEMSDAAGPDDWYAGPWPRTTRLRLYAAPAAAGAGYGRTLTAARPGRGGDAVVRPAWTVTETAALSAPRSEAAWAWFESPPLARDVRVFGAPVLRLWSTSLRTWITVAASVVDVDPAAYRAAGGQRVLDPRDAYGVTRAWLDSRYRDGRRTPSDWAPGGNGLTAVAKPVDWTFRAGHQIGLLVATEELDWVAAKPYGGPEDPAVGIGLGGRTWLDLPVVGPVATRALFRRSAS